MYSFDGEKILVVGGSSGIGLGTAKAAFEAGADVTIAGRSAERLDEASVKIGGVGQAVLDATDDKAVETFFKKSGPWHHIVTTIGKGGRGLIQDLDMKTAYSAMDAKFWPYFRIARAAEIVSGGSLTFVTGGLGQKPAPGASVLSAVNAAVEGLSRGLAIDFAPTRVNAVSPGPIDTPLWDQFPPDARKEHYKRMAENLPAGQMGQPDDVGQAILMLMGNPFITGIVLNVDGGSMLV
ncbi:MAG: SDR family oxidoreductase [Rhodospirillales bacterium]|nr:SDR family oxidoreductase [Rhodospirillales bacterium]